MVMDAYITPLDEACALGKAGWRDVTVHSDGRVKIRVATSGRVIVEMGESAHHLFEDMHVACMGRAQGRRVWVAKPSDRPWQLSFVPQ